jgi:hypothetical protein
MVLVDFVLFDVESWGGVSEAGLRREPSDRLLGGVLARVDTDEFHILVVP